MSSVDLSIEIQTLLEQVRQRGAHADFIFDATSSSNLKVNQGQLESQKVYSTQLLGVRTLKSDQVGIAYSESLEPAALTTMLEQALENAAVSQQDEHQVLASESDWASGVAKDALFQAETASGDELLASLKQLEQRIIDTPNIKSCPYNGITSSVHGRRIFSTAGLDVQSIESSCSAFAYALGEANQQNAMAGTGQVARAYAGLDLEQLAEDIQSKTLDMLEGKPIATARYDVIFSAECLSDILGVFAMAFSGKSAADGLSPWREKLGQSVSKSGITIYDKPSLHGFGACFFDDEGHRAQDTLIIEQGKLQTFLHNTATAKAAGVASTGHGVRGPKSTLSVGHHQLNVMPGTFEPTALRLGEYLEITHLTGLHSGANSISGDFSFGASGYVCRDGVRGQVVRGITIAGNFYDCLDRILIDTDQQWDWQQSMLLPGIRFEGMAVSGH